MLSILKSCFGILGWVPSQFGLFSNGSVYFGTFRYISIRFGMFRYVSVCFVMVRQARGGCTLAHVLIITEHQLFYKLVNTISSNLFREIDKSFHTLFVPSNAFKYSSTATQCLENRAAPSENKQHLNVTECYF